MYKKILPVIILVIIVGGGSFYGGMKYAQSKNAVGRNASVAGFQNLSPEERQQRLSQLQTSGGGSGAIGQNRKGFISGEIIKKDENSITVKLPDGGSKIIFLSSTTNIGKTVDGSVADLEVGRQVMVNDSVNSDGSVTAQSIQIRPKNPNQP